jgi:hypothetical protein
LEGRNYGSFSIDVWVLFFQDFPWIIKIMAKTATLSTNLDPELKLALSAYCKRRGLKIQSVVEAAIREQLEDEIDLAAYFDRKDEAEVSLSTVIKKLRK